jgi:hypothetical protein
MVKSLDKMGELRSALAVGDMSGLDLTGMPEDVVRHYLARVPVDVLTTGCEWYREGGAPWKYTLQPIRKGGTLMLCGVPWIELGESDLARLAPRWVCGASWSMLHIWEDWARANAPEHLDAPRRCIEVTWAYLDVKASEEDLRRAQDAAYAACAASAAADSASAAYAAYAASAAYAVANAVVSAAYAAYAASAAAYAAYAANAAAHAAAHADFACAVANADSAAYATAHANAANVYAARERHKRVMLRWWTKYVLEEMR